MKYKVTRDLAKRERYGALESINKGDIIYRFDGCTYGCIANGQACSVIDGETPFFEMPFDAIKEAL